MKEIIIKAKNFIFSKGKTSVALFLGISGIILIALSGTGKEKETVPISAESESDSDYCAELEQKVKNLVSAITGDDSCIVAVTLETGSEYVYADQNTTDSDRTADSGDGNTTNKESLKQQQEYIIVKDSNGGENALIITEKKPQVRGVAIVSEGISADTEERILKSVTSMLGIASRKISITAKLS